ncbi:MAG TPA: DUF1598 domain-containing protein [Pirellulales bacterium]|jgi:hypothetical protein|nr:DUF1598 domain-containing protein [Pirellulales bacterium]
MAHRFPRYVVFGPYLATAVLVLGTLLSDTPLTRPRESGGCAFLGGGQGVGGISIGTDGILKNSVAGEAADLKLLRNQAQRAMVGDLAKPSPLRKISLRRLAAAIAAAQAGGQSISDEMRLLAGLQRIQYVFVYPEQHDIVLAGYGEGWKVDDRGNVVGNGNGRPVMLLDDLLVALRSAREAQRGGIICSIDPTTEGLKRLREFVSTLSTIGDPQTTISTIEQTLGKQVVSIHGVPPTSHFARILVAADYRMKRLGMGFDRAPILGLPSYLQMVQPGPRGMQNMMPRWWLVPDYDPLLTDGQGLVWELPGGRVKAMTEETFLGEGGARPNTGKVSSMAQRWADNMTAKYSELSAKEPIFGQLRNCMDLAVAAALIVKENLAFKTGCDLGVLLNAKQLPSEELFAPKRIDTQASFVKKGNNWVISASGGVQIQPWSVLTKSEKNDRVVSARGSGEPGDLKHWWWD